jgi:UMF1 family MFS transporter
MNYPKSKIFTWTLYDFAKTIFSMNVVSLNFPLMIRNNYNGADFALSVARSSAMVMVALSMPLAGVVADIYKRRMPLTILFTLVFCVATALLGRGGSIYMQLALFALALYGYNAANVFYDAILPQIAPPDKLGRISGYGIAFGYVGTLFGLSVVGFLAGPQNYTSAFLYTGAFVLIFSLPFFFTVKDANPLPLNGVWKTTIDSIKHLYVVYNDAKSLPGVLRFMLGRFFIVDALETIIFFMAIYIKEAEGFSDKTAVLGNLPEITVFLLIVTTFAVLGSLAWAFITDKFGPRNSLLGTVILWVITLICIIFISNKAIFYVLASLAGISLGGVWTTERPLLINLVADNKKMAEFFGLFALTGKMAAVVGPLIWGITVLVFEPLGVIKYRFAVGTVLIMMVTGLWILRKVPDARQST